MGTHLTKSPKKYIKNTNKNKKYDSRKILPEEKKRRTP